MTAPTRDPERRGLPRPARGAARPATVEAYRRDLAAFAAWLGSSPSTATTEDLERYLAELRAAGPLPATIARRIAPIRAFFRHLVLLGARDDNPAAELDLPRRRRRLPRTLSPGEAERLIEAAAGTTRARSRPRARRAAVRRRAAGQRGRGARSAGVDLDERLVRSIGKGDKERVVPIGRQAAEALRRYLARGRPHLDRRHRPELFLNAQGGALTRAAPS